MKSELVREVQLYYGCPDVFELVQLHWRAVADGLAVADRVVVLGYSFPLEDTYGRFFFQEGMRERQSGEPLRIEFYDLDAEPVAAAIYRTLPGKPVLEFKGPVTPAHKLGESCPGLRPVER